MSKTEQGPPLRIKAVAVKLARVETSGAANTTGTPKATIKNPSRRLSCMFSLTFEPDEPKAVASYTSSTWTVQAMRPNRRTGKRGELHALVSAQALPNAYELDSAIRELKIATSLAIPTTAGAAAIAGDWVLLVEWEPNQPAMCDKEIEDLFSFCDATVDGEVTLRP